MSDHTKNLQRDCRLVLADGSIFRGHAFGAVGRGTVVEAEVVFNTAMSGYQESLTDPSYRNQILVETFPLIGNTGINDEDTESDSVQVSGFVVRELARKHSNFRATGDLGTWLAQAGILGISGIDTRAITRKLRSEGAMGGVLTDDLSLSDAKLVTRAQAVPSMAGQNLVPQVGISVAQDWAESTSPWIGTGLDREDHAEEPLRVFAFDCGSKRNILRHLTSCGCCVRLIPHDTEAAEILEAFASGACDGLFVSNGPGDPAAVQGTIKTLTQILDSKLDIPVFGICLGHQLLALACGAKTYKLPFGHRGTNQPVLECERGKVEITSQNHGFAVERESLQQAGGVVTHEHLNDQTVAGFRLKDKPVFAVQYHPEASPGPHDAAGLFDIFVSAMRAAQQIRAAQ